MLRNIYIRIMVWLGAEPPQPKQKPTTSPPFDPIPLFISIILSVVFITLTIFIMVFIDAQQVFNQFIGWTAFIVSRLAGIACITGFFAIFVIRIITLLESHSVWVYVLIIEVFLRVLVGVMIGHTIADTTGAMIITPILIFLRPNIDSDYGRAIILAAFINFLLLFFISLIIGGDAWHGKITGGRYYLGHRGVYTETNYYIFMFSKLHLTGMAILMGLGVMIGIVFKIMGIPNYNDEV